ncbi:MAG: [protein-PII] uridylyltransferase [Pseudomonadota bacterium]|nr:[protein-PII] uridylyltransferase [Pseudomonadota bacterium]
MNMVDPSAFVIDFESPSPERIKQYLADQRQHLETAFYELDSSATVLVQRYAQVVDQLLIQLWHHHMGNTPAALIAVGGYGRNELFPFSDIDLLVLVDEWTTQIEETLSDFIRSLWDTGLKIGHSCRTIDECVEQAKGDLTIITNLMESRFMVGQPILHDQLIERTSPRHIWPAKAFFLGKLEEQKQRYARHNFTEYNVEPDIKNAPGGIRDINTVLWIARRYFNVSTLGDLIAHGFLTTAEKHSLDQCREFLFRLRFALHLHTQKEENHLLFNYQKSIAIALKYDDGEQQNNQGIEMMMQDYYTNAQRVSHINELLLQFFEQDLLASESEQTVIELDERYEIRNGFLGAKDPMLFVKAPEAMLEIFNRYAVTKEIQGIQAMSIRQIMANLDLIDDAYRENPLHNELFVNLFKHCKYHLTTPLRLMRRYGVLGKYMPQFDMIVGMMQYDLFHIYTVDVHTLKVVENMRLLRYESTAEELPLATDIYSQLPRKELLYLSGVFHDIAKGRGGDHSELGAADAREFGEQHNLGQWDTELIAWLTEHHLLMSITAQKKDLSDPDVIHEFASIVGDLTHLNYLYCLTVCDIRATNPKLWNAWRAELLQTLYRLTKRQLVHGLNNPIAAKNRVADNQSSAMKALISEGFAEAQVAELWAPFGDDYFLRETWQDIAWHTRAILNQTNDKPLVLMQEATFRDMDAATQIFIYTPDQPHLFSHVVKALDKLGLSILDARVMTSEGGQSLDTFIVENQSRMCLNNEADQQVVRTTLQQAITDPASLEQYSRPAHLPRQYKFFSIKTRVFLSNNLQDSNTVIEVHTLDLPGLLVMMSDIFNDYKFSIQGARIATLGERVEDYFFVTMENGEPLRDPELCQTLSEKITQRLEAAINEQTTW